MRTCYRCEYTIDIENRADSMYCSESCRKAYESVRRRLITKLRLACEGFTRQEALELEVIGQSDLEKFLRVTPATNVDYPSISRDEAIELGLGWMTDDHHDTITQRLLKSDTDIEAAIVNDWDAMETEATEMMNRANGLVVNNLIGHPQDEYLIDNDPQQD